MPASLSHREACQREPNLLLARILANGDDDFHELICKAIVSGCFLLLENANDAGHLQIVSAYLRKILCIKGLAAVRDILIVDIDFLGQREHLADGQSRVEIIIHGLIEVFQQLVGRSGKFCRRVCSPLFLREFIAVFFRVGQTAEARLRFFETLIREIKRLR